MATRIDDRWLWLGLGAFTFLALKAISPALHHIAEQTIVTTRPPIPPIGNPYAIHTGKESAIKTSSLETLALSPNIDIRRAATKILCERFFAHIPSRNRLLKDIHSEDVEKRRRAKLAFDLLVEYDIMSAYAITSGTEQGRSRRRGVGQRGFYAEPRQTSSWRSRGTGRGDIEQRNLRRRHREAMVINEGDRPVSGEDVWMRDGEGRMSTEEERDSRDLLLEGVPRDMEARNARRMAAMEALGMASDDPMLANIEFWDTPITDGVGGGESEMSSSSNETSE